MKQPPWYILPYNQNNISSPATNTSHAAVCHDEAVVSSTQDGLSGNDRGDRDVWNTEGGFCLLVPSAFQEDNDTVP